MNRADRIAARLDEALSPTLLRVVDESSQHAGHAGAAPGGETHFRVVAVAQSFAGRSRVERSRMVHDLLRGELESGLHALALTLRAPDEAPTTLA